MKCWVLEGVGRVGLGWGCEGFFIICTWAAARREDLGEGI